MLFQLNQNERYRIAAKEVVHRRESNIIPTHPLHRIGQNFHVQIHKDPSNGTRICKVMGENNVVRTLVAAVAMVKVRVSS